MAKKPINTVLIIIGIVLVIFLFTKTEFFGSLLTTCENNEPSDASGYLSFAASKGWGNTNMGQMGFQTNNGTVQSNIIKFTAPDFNFYIVDPAEYTCGEIAVHLDIAPIDPSMNTKHGKRLYYDGNNYYFCNDDNSIMIYTESIPSFDGYMTVFESCTTTEVADTNTTTTTSSVSTSSTTTTTIKDLNATAKNPVIEQRQSVSTAKEDSIFGINKTQIYILLVILIIGVWYFFFEKGEKGLFKGF